MKITTKELQEAGIPASILSVFDYLTGGEMELTEDNLKLLEATQIDIYQLTSKLLPTDVYQGLMAKFGELHELYVAQVQASDQEYQAAITEARFAIVDPIKTAVGEIAQDYELLFKNPMFLLTWDGEQDQLLKPSSKLIDSVLSASMLYQQKKSDASSASSEKRSIAQEELRTNRRKVFLEIVEEAEGG